LPPDRKITITGYINQCYEPDTWLVFITSLPRERFESEAHVLRADARFRFVLATTQLKPGTYLLEFGKTRKGAGGLRFTVTPATTTIDLGELGECDV
jgi:hypothetical protein